MSETSIPGTEGENLSLPEIPASVLADRHPTPTHCGISVKSLYVRLMPALLPLVVAGVVFLGWRALVSFGIVLASTVAGVSLWRLVGQRGKGMLYVHGIYLGCLLGLLMPAELARNSTPPEGVVGAGWPLLVGAGFLLSMLYWLFGGVGARLHPVAATVLLLATLFPGKEPQSGKEPIPGPMTPTSVLVPKYLFQGDILRSVPGEPTFDPMLSTLFGPSGSGDEVAKQEVLPAVRMETAATRLSAFTKGTPSADGNWVSLDALIREKMPPLEDLIFGGHPAVVGLTSLVAVLGGGLILLHRGGADWRIPMLMLVTAGIGFVCLRLPVVVTGTGPVWRWVAFTESGVTLSTMLTFASYQIAAGPLVFVAFFLATSGASCPTSHWGKMVYAVLLGAGSAAGQLYVSVAVGPLLALLLISLFSPVLDRVLRPKPLL